MTGAYNLSELVESVNRWCAGHGVVPANGQAAGELSERSVRFYRTIGLVDGPEGAGAGYGEKHRWQLIAVRVLQAQGFPLRRIREWLYGRTLDELREVARRGLESGVDSRKRVGQFLPVSAVESWTVTPLDDDFLLVSRSGRSVPPPVIERLRQVLACGAENGGGQTGSAAPRKP